MEIDIFKVNLGDLATVFLSRADSCLVKDFDPKETDVVQFKILGCMSRPAFSDRPVLHLLCDKPVLGSKIIYPEPFIDNLKTLANDEADLRFRIINDFHSYRGKYGRWVGESYIQKITAAGPDGCFCKVCREFYPMAVPNQPDNTLKCFACRQNPMRAYY